MWGGGGGIVEAEIGGRVKLLTLFTHKINKVKLEINLILELYFTVIKLLTKLKGTCTNLILRLLLIFLFSLLLGCLFCIDFVSCPYINNCKNLIYSIKVFH